MVSIDAGNSVTINQSDLRVFVAKLDELCGGNSKPRFEWKGQKGTEHILSNSKDDHRLLIKPDDLRTGTYSFTVHVAQSGLTGQATINVHVEHSHIVASIDKGDGSVTNALDLVLSA